MTREQMMDIIISQYGFESFTTVSFCIICESKYTTDEQVINLFNTLNREV